jgi:hypothetical protein
MLAASPHNTLTQSHLQALSKAGAASEGLVLDKHVILPDSAHYRAFWTLTVAGAFVTAVVEPYLFAFKHNPGIMCVCCLSERLNSQR